MALDFLSEKVKEDEALDASQAESEDDVLATLQRYADKYQELAFDIERASLGVVIVGPGPRCDPGPGEFRR